MVDKLVHVWLKESTRDKLKAMRTKHETIDDVVAELIETCMRTE